MSTKREHSAGRGVATVDRETGSAIRQATGPVPESGAGSQAATGPAGEDVAGGDRTTGASRRAETPATETPAAETPATETNDARAEGAPDKRRHAPLLGTRRRRRALAVVAVLGIVGTVGFGHAWAVQRTTLDREAVVRTTAQNFLLALTNFTSKNVDTQFNEVQSFATGSFESQSNQFFGSSIRQQLEAALASSRGQIRNLYVQSAAASTASVYAVVDQTYVNDKMRSPAADVLRVVVNLTDTAAGWKISAVTVLNNPSSSPAPASGTSSNPAG